MHTHTDRVYWWAARHGRGQNSNDLPLPLTCPARASQHVKRTGLSPSYYASRSLARVLILRSAARISGSAFILGVILARMSCAALA